ncbi:hypothetical protein GCM10017778_31140 [Streptomyces vinaceus]|nr:hypothetical protein GCM10017778_31140 [Streptomyces vinaceus]
MSRRVLGGRPVAHVAAEMGISRPTAHKWVRRWRAEGEPAFTTARAGRPRPRSPPRPGSRPASAAGGPAASSAPPIGPIVDPPASMVHRILVRHGLNRLAWLDRLTGQPVRRYERARPGALVHVDIKKLGNIPDNGSCYNSTLFTQTLARAGLTHKRTMVVPSGSCLARGAWHRASRRYRKAHLRSGGWASRRPARRGTRRQGLDRQDPKEGLVL